MPHALITSAQQKMKEAITHFETELGSIRTGRAHTGLVENLMVNSYGSKVALKTVASITISDKTTIAIQPWDKSIVSDIEKALREGQLGAQPVSDGHTIRLPLPAPTEEQRKQLGKKVHEMAEHARISVRTIRTETHSQLRKQKEDSGITEDDFYSLDKELQAVVDATNKSIETHANAKEKEIMTV